MKGLKKLALVSAIAAVSAGAQAELKALDDATMGEMTGQAGLTIDIETKFTIGEFAYHDAGYVILEGIRLGANENNGANGQLGSTTLLDNFRMTIDVAGLSGSGTEILNHGLSEVAGLAAVHIAASNGDVDMSAASLSVITSGALTSTDGVGGLTFETKKSYGDGDLLIHFGFTDAWQQGGGFAAYAAGKGADGSGGTASLATLSYATARDIASKAVDFNFSIDLIAIADSTYTVGSQATEDFIDAVTGEITGTNHLTGLDATPETTALISGLSINGYLGNVDIHIENNGNGFTGGPSGPGTGDADSKIIWGSYFNITDLDLYIDIAGVQLTDVTIDNSRGDLSDINGNASIGFAHAIRTIFAVKDSVLHLGLASAAGSTNGLTNATGLTMYHDGVAINTVFKGDLSIGALSFGDTGVSIGEIYLTDIKSTTNWTISAH